MGVLVWAMMGLAIWHFTIFLPDKFWGGIVGAFVGAVVGSILVGLAINGFSVPTNDELELLTAIDAIPGAIVGIGLIYFIGARREEERPTLGV